MATLLCSPLYLPRWEETNETGETGTEDAKRSCPAALKKKQHLFLVMNLDLTVPYCAVVVDFAECFVASFKEEEAVSSLRRKAESPWFEEEMREWSRVEVSDMLSTMERDQYDKFRLHLPKLDYRTAERIIISIVDDGWWWMMMDDDGWWWMMMDDRLCMSMSMDGVPWKPWLRRTCHQSVRLRWWPSWELSMAVVKPCPLVICDAAIEAMAHRNSWFTY